MINVTLYRHGFLGCLRLLAIFIMVLALYIITVIWMFDPALGSALEQFSETMPEMMSAFGMSDQTSTLVGFIAQYLYGSFFLVFPMVFTVLLSKRLVVDMVDKGSMACLLSSPNTRGKVIRTQVSVLLSALVVMLAVSVVISIVTSELLFPGDLDNAAFLRLNIGTLCLQFTIAGFCLLASCCFNDSGRAVLAAAGVPVVFYLIKMLANMGGDLENLKYATFYSLFDSTALIDGKGDAYVSMAILAAAGVAFFMVAAQVFRRRNLSL